MNKRKQVKWKTHNQLFAQSSGAVEYCLSTPSLPSLPGPLWPGVVAPDKGPYLWVK